jgi:hypothetical protein
MKPAGSALILVGCIQIWIQESKNDPQKRKNGRKFQGALLRAVDFSYFMKT